MMDLLMFDEGEVWILIYFFLPLVSLIVIVGFLVPIGAAITYAIYHFRLKYKFTWEKEHIEMEKATLLEEASKLAKNHSITQ